jgi:hypothetical protein
MSTFFSRKKSTSKDEQIHATRDWFVLVAIAIILVLASTLYNLWLVARITSGQSFGVSQKATVVPDVSTKSVDAIFAARGVSQNTYVHSYYIVDPSSVSR